MKLPFEKTIKKKKDWCSEMEGAAGFVILKSAWYANSWLGVKTL